MTLVTDEVLHPIGKIQPLLIGLNGPDQVECSRTGARLPGLVRPKACWGARGYALPRFGLLASGIALLGAALHWIAGSAMPS